MNKFFTLTFFTVFTTAIITTESRNKNLTQEERAQLQREINDTILEEKDAEKPRDFSDLPFRVVELPNNTYICRDWQFSTLHRTGSEQCMIQTELLAFYQALQAYEEAQKSIETKEPTLTTVTPTNEDMPAMNTTLAAPAPLVESTTQAPTATVTATQKTPIAPTDLWKKLFGPKEN